MLKNYLTKLQLTQRLAVLSNYSVRNNSNQSAKHELKPFSAIPGPRELPLVGSLFSLKQMGGDLDIKNLLYFLKQLQQKYGDLVRFSLLGDRQVFTFNPDHIKKLFQAEGNSPNRRIFDPWDVFSRRKGLPSSLLNSQNEVWRKQRSAANPIVARPATVAQYLPKHDLIADEFISIINSKFKIENSIIENKFNNSLKLLTFEMIGIMAFDERINCLDETKCDKNIFKLIEITHEFDVYSAKLALSVPLYKYIRTKDYKNLEKLGDQIYSIAGKYVSKALEKIKNNKSLQENDGEKTMLEQFILNKDKSKLTIDEITTMMIDFLLAGITTTANTLHYLLYELGKNKKIQDELYNEVMSACKLNEPVTDEVLTKIPLLKACVKETLRMHGILPGNVRVIKDDLILDDYLIPKNTTVNLVTIETSTSEKYYQNALEFNPKRWLATNKNIHPFTTLPFGHGARMCIGRRIAEQEMYLIMIKLIQNFNIDYIGEDEGNPVWLTLISPKNDLKVRLTKRPLTDH